MKGMVSLKNSLYIAALCLLGGYVHKFFLDQRMAPLLVSYRKPECTKIGEGVLHGPEDLALDTTTNLVFVSSHNRRKMTSVGALFAIDMATDTLIHLPDTFFPPHFRPHGIALAESCSPWRSGEGSVEQGLVTRLFVISHVGLSANKDINEPAHTVEVFDFSLSSSNSSVPAPLLRHVHTMAHSHLHHPNDLLALNCDELIISNDLPSGGLLRVASDLLLKTRSANLVHVHLHRSAWTPIPTVTTSHEAMPPPKASRRRGAGGLEGHGIPASTSSVTLHSRQATASFGNGVITLPHSRVSAPASPAAPLLLRSSSADYTLLDYRFSHSSSVGHVKLSNETSTELPISPDNLEPSPLHAMEVLITGHPSLPAFLLNALFPFIPAPSAVLRYNAFWGNSSLLYYSQGGEISASSVAVMSDQGKLYIGQVFDSFVLSCAVVL